MYLINPLDDALIERALAGDGDAFGQLVARYSRRVFTVARHFFRDPETVEDLAQQTFAGAFFSPASLRRGASIERCLTRIAVNNCYAELRRRRPPPVAVTAEEAAWLESRLACGARGPLVGEGERERAAEVAEKLLSRLSPETRLILVLLHAEECSAREIAQLTGWSGVRVKLCIFRARREVRRALGRLAVLVYPTPESGKV